MKFDLQVSRKPFAELLRAHKHMEIPPFQRPYAWRLEHWSQLWDDLTTHLDQDYLMGGIVLCGGDNGSDLVIDGQQRIATITLLIAVCRDYLWRECSGERAKLAAGEIHSNYVVSGGVVEATNKPYITLGDLERTWYADRIQRGPTDSVYSPPDLVKVPYKQPGSVRLLWKSYQYFHKQLLQRHSTLTPDQKTDDVIRIIRQLATFCWFVITRVPDDTQAYTLFEVLNDRGLELSISDLFKNKILSHAAEVGKLDTVKEMWGEIVDALDYQNIAAFLRYYWISHNGKKTTENDLFPRFKDEVKAMKAPELVAYVKSLSVEAENFAQIIGRSKLRGPLAREIKLINSYGFRIGNTVLLAVWAATADEKIRLSVLREVKKFSIKYAIFANQVTNELEAIMAEIAVKMRVDLQLGITELTSRFKKALPSRKLIKEGFLALEPSNSVARALLVEIETHLAGSEKTISEPDEVNIEHIFPQSPSKEWSKAFGAGEEEDSFMARLGNLTLLDAKLNKQASNKPYKQKRQEFYCDSEFKITTQLPKVSNWTVKSVVDRQEELFELACVIWSID